MCSFCVPSVILVFPWYVPDVFPIYTCNVPNVFQKWSWCVPEMVLMCFWCVPYVFLVFPVSWCVFEVFLVCSLNIPDMFLCSDVFHNVSNIVPGVYLINSWFIPNISLMFLMCSWMFLICSKYFPGAFLIQGPPKNLPMSIYPISSIAHPNQTLSYNCVELLAWEMKYTPNNSTRSVNIKITLQSVSPDHREIN